MPCRMPLYCGRPLPLVPHADFCRASRVLFGVGWGLWFVWDWSGGGMAAYGDGGREGNGVVCGYIYIGTYLITSRGLVMTLCCGVCVVGRVCILEEKKTCGGRKPQSSPTNPMCTTTNRTHMPGHEASRPEVMDCHTSSFLSGSRASLPHTTSSMTALK